MRQRELTLNNVGEQFVEYRYYGKKEPIRVYKVVRITSTLALCHLVGSLYGTTSTREHRIKRWHSAPSSQEDVDAAMHVFTHARLTREKEEQARKLREADPHFQAVHRVSNQINWSILSLDQLKQIISWLDAAIAKGIADGKDS